MLLFQSVAKKTFSLRNFKKLGIFSFKKNYIISMFFTICVCELASVYECNQTKEIKRTEKYEAHEWPRG